MANTARKAITDQDYLAGFEEELGRIKAGGYCETKMEHEYHALIRRYDRRDELADFVILKSIPAEDIVRAYSTGLRYG